MAQDCIAYVFCGFYELEENGGLWFVPLLFLHIHIVSVLQHCVVMVHMYVIMYIHMCAEWYAYEFL